MFPIDSLEPYYNYLDEASRGGQIVFNPEYQGIPVKKLLILD